MPLRLGDKVRIPPDVVPRIESGTIVTLSADGNIAYVLFDGWNTGVAVPVSRLEPFSEH